MFWVTACSLPAFEINVSYQGELSSKIGEFLSVKVTFPFVMRQRQRLTR